MKTALFLLFLSLLSCKKDVSVKEYFNFIDDSWIETISTQAKGGPLKDDYAQVKVKKINEKEIHLVYSLLLKTVQQLLLFPAQVLWCRVSWLLTSPTRNSTPKIAVVLLLS